MKEAARRSNARLAEIVGQERAQILIDLKVEEGARLLSTSDEDPTTRAEDALQGGSPAAR